MRMSLRQFRKNVIILSITAHLKLEPKHPLTHVTHHIWKCD